MLAPALNFAKSARSIPASSSQKTMHRGFADMSLFVARRLAGVAIVAFAVGACSPQSSVAAAPQTAGSTCRRRRASHPLPSQPVGTLNGRVLPDFATLVEQVGPAVVNVSVLEKAHRVARGNRDDAQDDQVEEFFRRFGIAQPARGGGANRRSVRAKAPASS